MHAPATRALDLRDLLFVLLRQATSLEDGMVGTDARSEATKARRSIAAAVDALDDCALALEARMALDAPLEETSDVDPAFAARLRRHMANLRGPSA